MEDLVEDRLKQKQKKLFLKGIQSIYYLIELVNLFYLLVDLEKDPDLEIDMSLKIVNIVAKEEAEVVNESVKIVAIDTIIVVGEVMEVDLLVKFVEIIVAIAEEVLD